MKTVETLTANKWYPLQAKGKPLYPSPQSILRRAVGAEEYKFVSETVTTDHIRAACVMPMDVPFQHLLSEVPWGMSYNGGSWRMLIVSTLDPNRWLTLARASGAIGWLKGHNQTITYNWEPPEVDEHGLKKRPGNALGVTGEKKSKRFYPQRIAYDKASILEDLRTSTMSHREIGEKHGVGRLVVFKISKDHGLSNRRPHHGYSYK